MSRRDAPRRGTQLPLAFALGASLAVRGLSPPDRWARVPRELADPADAAG